VRLLASYIKAALRNIRRNKIYSIINVSGLSIGLTAVVLLTTYVEYETGYDRQHANRERLYRVVRRTAADGKELVSTGVSGAVRDAALETIPQVEDATRIWDGRGSGPRWMRYGDLSLSVDFWLTGDNFLKVFDFPLLRGERSTLFEKPYSVAITEDMAQRFFKDEDPIGKIVTLEHVWFGGDYTVTGILANPPTQSSLQFEVISTTEPTSNTTPYYAWKGWCPSFSWIPVQTWLLLEPNAKIELVEQSLNALMAKHLGAEIAATDTYHLQKITRIHLYRYIDFGSDTEDHAGDSSGGNDIRKLQTAAGIVLLLMLIASMNFTNLATARSLTLAREVGVRKVTGASKRDIIMQYMTEALVLAFASLIVSLGIAQPVFPLFAGMLETNLELTADILFSLIPFLGLISLLYGVMAGLYPALFLAYLSPAQAVRPGYVPGSPRALLRMGLLTFQFAASILLVIASGAMSTQMEFVSNKELGFQKEHVILLPLFEDGRGADVEGNISFTERYETATIPARSISVMFAPPFLPESLVSA
jgi:putative ABC transport system permease protein